jgi:hypothetical protein
MERFDAKYSRKLKYPTISVQDLEPDPYVFGPPGSGFVIFFNCTDSDQSLDPSIIKQKYEKTLIYIVLRLLYDFYF